jgi:hypothetical protein
MTLDDQSPQSVSPSSDEPKSDQPQERPRKRRGFAAMDPKKVSEIASKGGKAAHRAGTAHEFTPDEAREAGRKGGYATHAKRKATESSPDLGGEDTAKPEPEPEKH